MKFKFKQRTTLGLIKLAVLGLFLSLCPSWLIAQQYTANFTAQQASGNTGPNCATANACLPVLLVPPGTQNNTGNGQVTGGTGIGSAVFNLSGSSGNTVQFEASGDNGTTWQPLLVTPSNSSSQVSSTSGTGAWQANVGAYTEVRMRCSTYVSGTTVATITISTASARNGGSGGGGGSGTVTNVSCVSGCTVANPTTTPSITVTASGGGSVFPVTVSGTVNSGGIPCFNSTANEESSAALSSGVIPKGGGAGSCIGASSITDNGTTVTTAEPVVAGASVSTTADGVHPGVVQLPGNTTLPSLTANTVSILGPPSATPTAWSLQLPTAIPTTTDLFSCVVTSTNCLLTDSGVAVASGKIAISSIGTSGLSGTAPVAISAAGAISITGAAGQVLAGVTPAFTATPALGTDNSVAGTLQTANGSANAHTTWGSAATTSNTILGFATAPTTTDLITCVVSSTTCTLTDSGIAVASNKIAISAVGTSGLSGTSPVTISAAGAIGCATCVVASSPGAGIAHFAGSTQTVTSSAVVNADITSVAESKLTGSAAATSITEVGTGDAITRLGVETGNLTAPYVFVNTNSTNSNTSIGLGITTPGTSTGQTTLNINGAATGGDLTDWGTGGTWAAGVLSGQTILAKVGINGAFTGLNFTSNGTTAGFMDFAQGSTSAAVAPCNTATSVCIQAPAAVTSYLMNLPPASANGIITNNVSAAVITQGISGDAGHSATVTTGSGTSIGSTSLCSTALCTAGTYVVNTYIDITTACGTSGTYVVNLIYTDDQGSKTIPVNINGTGAVPATGVLTTTSTSNFGENAQVIRSTGAASINYSTTAVACGTAGPMVGKLYLSVVPVQ